MKFSINRKYTQAMEKATRKAKKFSRLYACDPGAMLEMEWEENTMQFRYSAVGESREAIYTLKDIKRCEVSSGGCLLLFRDKKYVFLPVTDAEENDSELIDFCEMLHEELDGLHFFVIQRLSVAQDKETGKRMRIGFSKSDSPIGMIVMAVLSALLATVFVTQSADYEILERSQCSAYTGLYASYSADSNDYVDVHLTNKEYYTVHYANASDDFLEKLDALEKGAYLEILENPKAMYVVEILADGQEILNFDTAQTAMLQAETGFVYLGIALYIGAAYLLGYGIYQLIKEKREEKAYGNFV